MKKTLTAGLLATALLMTACNEKTSQNGTAPAATQNAEQGVKQQIPVIFAEDMPIFVKKDQFSAVQNYGDEKENVDVSMDWEVIGLKTGIDWLDALLLQQIDGTAGSLAKEFDARKQELQQEPVFASELSQSLSFIHQREKLALFVKNTHVFEGGAHGLPSVAYINVDLHSRKIFNLSDVFSPQALETVKEKLWQVYTMNGEEPFSSKEYFGVSEQFELSPVGITFHYQPYEIGSYAEGFKELGLSWYEIWGIVKPEFKQQQYFPEPKIIEE